MRKGIPCALWGRGMWKVFPAARRLRAEAQLLMVQYKQKEVRIHGKGKEKTMVGIETDEFGDVGQLGHNLEVNFYHVKIFTVRARGSLRGANEVRGVWQITLHCSGDNSQEKGKTGGRKDYQKFGVIR